MVSQDPFSNGLENGTAPGAQGNNDIVMQAELTGDGDEIAGIRGEADLREAFSSIRDEVETTISPVQLKLLYRRGADLIELLDKPGFQERAGAQLDDLRGVAEEEFARTARTLNRRGEEIGAKSNFAEKWGG